MLDRVYAAIESKTKIAPTQTIPFPEVVKDGKKSSWTNFLSICTLMQRSQEHVMSFFLTELVTEGSINGDNCFLLKGIYTPSQFQNILKKYICEYVICQTCHNPHTILDIQRMCTVTCQNCGSSRSVMNIKSGFHATSRADRKAVKNAK